jgi:regulator of nonsense transcripts 2
MRRLQLTAVKEDLVLVAPLGIAFAKHLGQVFLPSAGGALDAEEQDFPALSAECEEVTDVTLVTREMKDKFRKLLGAYLDALGRREAKAHLVHALVTFSFWHAH